MPLEDTRLRLAAIPEFPWYSITTRGNLYKRKDGGGFKKIKATPRQHSGHLMALLYKAGFYSDSGKLRGFGRSIHCLVLEAFVGPCPAGMECRHLNGKEWDNDLSNLEWATRQRNIDDRDHLNELVRGSRKPNALITEADVVAMRKRAKAGDSARNIARDFGLKYMTALNAIVGRCWKHVTEPPAVLPKNRWKYRDA